MAAALRVGAGPEAAWRRVGVGTDDGVPRAADLLGLGGAGARHVSSVCAAVRLSLQVGTPAAALLERVTLAVARDDEAEGRRRAALAGPRAPARLLAWLPAVGLLLGASLGARPWEQLLGGGAGSLSGLLGLVLLVAGRRWTTWEIRSAERAGSPEASGDERAGRSRPCASGRRSRRRRRATALREPLPAAWVRSTAERAARGPGFPPGSGGAGWWRPRGARRAGRVGRLGDRPGPRSPVRRTLTAPGVEEAVLLDLVEGACLAGVGVPQAIDAVGAAVGGPAGAGLRRTARALGLGAPWDAAWRGTGPEVGAVARALRPAWEDGVPPAGLLRSAAEASRRDRDARASEAAARLGVRLVVPLGLCHLPAFVLVGLVPVLGSMAATTLGG
ncbi:type II secretion system F family protein [Actinotalea sp. Marseille-Q4924]|uniref:type II secretion system F family protein n=1 Tax=Actinotalea sp. Marseille-Q4924 TaxID=2866571 RepID=UPI001CE4343F|nr:type II secretion system F family protein [Actinotalea sp. Marseille-Q4924]